MSPEEDRRLYLQHMFTALHHYCLSVTGKAHVYTYAPFFDKYEVLKRHVRDYNGFKLVQLDLSPEAIRELEFCEDGIFFVAAFNGTQHEFYLPFDQMLGLTNCRDGVVHRLSIAPTASLHMGVQYMVMMDYSTGQTGPGPSTETKTELPAPPPIKRPTLTVVK
jgi:stringent starvation protein B